MAEKYRFMDAVQLEDGTYEEEYEYDAQDFTDYFKALVTTGIMKSAGNQLAVTTNGTNMITKIDTGIAFLLGRYYENDSFKELTHDTETLGNSRIDRIVVRMDLSTEARYVKAFIKKGVPSTNPVAPSLTQTSNLYEISLAQVKIVGGQTFIATNAVTDERGMDIICPWAGSNILPNFDDEALEDLINKVNTELVDASTTQKGIVQLNNTLTNTSTMQAATANAVKQVNDKFTAAEVAIGAGAVAKYHSSVAMGSTANAESSGTSIGAETTTDGLCVAIGRGARATVIASTALGASARALAEKSTAIGYSTAALNVAEGTIGVASSDVNGTKSWIVPGSFRVTGTKNFEIPHPHPNKQYTHVIRHGAVESPTTGDTLYRYTIEAVTEGETIAVQLPDYFEHLNTNVDVWVNPHKHFGRAFGEVVGDRLLVTCEKVGTYKALVIGTRNDENVQDWYIKGVEREVGESWNGETYSFEVDEITEITEFEEVQQ